MLPASTVLVAGLAFLLTGGAVFGITGLIGRRGSGSSVADRLGNITGEYSGQVPTAPVMSPQTTGGWNQSPQEPQSFAPTKRREDLLPSITKYLSARDIDRRLRLAMHQAGVRLRPAEYVVILLGGTVGLGLIGFLLTGRLYATTAMAFIGYITPVSIIRMRQNARGAAFGMQLPEALTLISSSLRTGYSFMNACEMVINELPQPISQEFAWARGEAQLGVPMYTALQRMVDRVKSYDLDLAVTAVGIQLQVGGNLAEILDTISATIRERIRIRGEIAALTAEGRLSGIIVFFMPIALGLFLQLRDPDYFRPMLHTDMGIHMLYATGVFMVLGGLIINKMVNMDV